MGRFGSPVDPDIDSKIEDEKKNLVKAIHLLLENGADLSAQNDDKNTPFQLALEHDKIDVLAIFAQPIRIQEQPQLFFSFKQRIFDDRYKDILISILEKDKDTGKITCEVMNVLNTEGFTPFLSYIDHFSTVCGDSEPASKAKKEVKPAKDSDDNSDQSDEDNSSNSDE